MIQLQDEAICITAMGVLSSIGKNKKEFINSLLNGCSQFDYMKREGRSSKRKVIGTEIDSIEIPDSISKRVLRSCSLSDQMALTVIHEIYEEGQLEKLNPESIGLIVGGSNINQRETLLRYKKYKDKESFINPMYGFQFLDSDLCGLLTEQYNIRGVSYTIGGASASGQLAIEQAIQSVKNHQVEACIAMGAFMDLSYYELEALMNLQALGSEQYKEVPKLACRPFDKNHDGFIYGEGCGGVLVETVAHARKRNQEINAIILGSTVVIDGNRNPNPTLESEIKVVQQVLQQANLKASEIDYINPHGSGSILGDKTELEAYKQCQLTNAYINTTKSITGHCLGASPIMEIIATVLQMNSNKLHPSLNLIEPIDEDFRWVRDKAISHTIENALSVGIGFGGINGAVCLASIKKENMYEGRH